jgi:hypothetical protein
MAEVSTAMYNLTPPAPMNALTTMGNLQTIKNSMLQNQLMQQELPILQQRQQQMLMDTQKQKGEMDSMGYMANPKYDQASGTKDFNGMLSDAAINAPYAVLPLMKQRDNYAEQINAGVYPQGSPNAGAQRMAPRGEVIAASMGGGPNSQTSQNDNTQQPITATDLPSPSQSAQESPVNLVKPPSNDPLANAHSLPTSMPTGYTSAGPQSRENYNKVTLDAQNAPTTNAAYNEVINMNNQGALTGTRLADAYQVAARNDPFHIISGATTEAAKSQEMQKWIAQGLISGGMPASDARLAELQHGNIAPEQLPETIKELAPFFKASTQGILEKQKYYNKVTDNGTNMATEPHALQQWNSNYDPRWVEFDQLKGKTAQHDFLMKHPDLLDKRDQFNNLQNMGVVKGVQ